MALLTNKLSISLVHEEFDARYDVFEVTKEAKAVFLGRRAFSRCLAPRISSRFSVKAGTIRSISLPRKVVCRRGGFAIISRTATAALSRMRI